MPFSGQIPGLASNPPLAFYLVFNMPFAGQIQYYSPDIDPPLPFSLNFQYAIFSGQIPGLDSDPPPPFYLSFNCNICT